MTSTAVTTTDTTLDAKGGTTMSEATEKTATVSRPVTPVGLNHLVLNVHDLEESHRFWTEVLGFHQVGEIHPREGARRQTRMRFYSGERDGQRAHHDIALMEQEGLNPKPDRWSMNRGGLAVNHIAICYPDRGSWLAQVEHVQAMGVEVNLRVNHGMTHSIYINDPNGYGVEVLYELPREIWEHDVDGALNYAEALPPERALEDDTDYPTTFGR